MTLIKMGVKSTGPQKTTARLTKDPQKMIQYGMSNLPVSPRR